jgi:hypothetical protein
VYCGSAYGYSINPDFRRQCDEAYPLWYGGNAGITDSLAGLQQWFTARWEGVEKGRRTAALMNLSGSAVYTGPEINSVRHLEEAGFPSVLSRVVPLVPFDFISYSSWESIDRENMAQELGKDVETIRRISGGYNVILGELGYTTTQGRGENVEKTEQAISAATKLSVPFVFLWVLYEGASHAGYGLIDETGQPTELASYYRARLSAISRK